MNLFYVDILKDSLNTERLCSGLVVIVANNYRIEGGYITNYVLS